MGNLTSKTNQASVPDNGRIIDTETVFYDDGKLLELAKTRLYTKRNLISQVFDFLFIIVCLFIIINLGSSDIRVLVSFAFCSLWGIRLLIRIVKFANPSFETGIATFFRVRQERSIEFEYNRLRKIKTNNAINGLDK